MDPANAVILSAMRSCTSDARFSTCCTTAGWCTTLGSSLSMESDLHVDDLRTPLEARSEASFRPQCPAALSRVECETAVLARSLGRGVTSQPLRETSRTDDPLGRASHVG